MSNKLDEIALDSEGRVLRRPNFLTLDEHEAILKDLSDFWAEMFIQKNAVVVILCRPRLLWVAKHLIKIVE